ncbi:hypothetical protein GIB67_017943 [Kingdonia uniflora]|uniref:DUF659 domain-containing protein n=1 Tax=Kingdonia uniflora TaxID=39325 RepID=A0A7J7MI87_9MAGN|nr:hypothetical protein GIB67_017943 [Kingdonia uniflora]
MGDSNDRLTTLETTVFTLTSTVGELVELALGSVSAYRQGRSHATPIEEEKGLEGDGDEVNTEKDNDSSDANFVNERPGGIRGDVVPCKQVPQDVMVKMRKDLLEKRSTREVLQLIDSNVPWTRDVCSNSTDESKHIPFVPTQPNCKRKDNVACVTPRENEPKRVLLSNKMGYSPGVTKTEETDEDSSMHAKRSVGDSFMKMLIGWILQEEKKEIDCYVKKVKHSWGITGCSILLDGWMNEKGRSLIYFLEDCPRGPIFLRLRNCESNAKEGDDDSDEMIDPMDDWIVDEAVTPKSSIDSVAWMNSNTIDNEEEPSTIQPNKEQHQ